MQKTVEEKNVVLAKFIGGKLVEEDKSPGEFRWWFGFHGEPIGQTAPRFNSDWNWLMKAWEKIAKTKSEKLLVDEMHLGMKSCSIKAMPIPYEKRNSSFISFYVVGDVPFGKNKMDLHDTAFEAIFEFVEWYNTRIA